MLLTKGEKMLTLDQIKEQLKDRRLYIVAKEIGVSYPTILAIAQGKAKNPSYRIVQLICEYLERK
jgi:transcriptional regulator with XRE-family HTH domain